MHEYLSGCYSVIGSMTQTMRARRVLERSAIRAEIVKADAAHKGCAYALSYACAQDGNVRNILSRAGIRPQAFYGGNG